MKWKIIRYVILKYKINKMYLHAYIKIMVLLVK